MNLAHLTFIFLGLFEIKNNVTGEFLSLDGKSVTPSNSNFEWKWIPKDGSDVWGFIKHYPLYPSPGYWPAGFLTTDKCTDGICTLKIQKKIKGQMKIEQHWRKWNNKIISKVGTRKYIVYVLTLNSQGNIVAMTPNDEENQDWSLIQK